MSALDYAMASMSHIRHYRVLPWATGLLTLLESIPKVPDRQVAKTGKLSIFFSLPSLVPGADEGRLVHTDELPIIKNGIAHVYDVYTV